MSKKTKKITSIGGSALIEGIMMRGPKKSTVCVRTGKDSIYSEDISITTIPEKCSFFKIPFFRGIAGLIDSMRLSYKSLMLSADKAIESAEIEEEPSKFEKWLDEKFGDKLVKVMMVIASVLGVALAIGLFFFLPSFLFDLCGNFIPAFRESDGNVEMVRLWKSVFEGVMKITLFFGYIIIVSQLSDMKRTFMYHGAEHKTIFCYENEEELTVANVKKQTRFHPRCGTSFMVIMLILGIVIGLFVPAAYSRDLRHRLRAYQALRQARQLVHQNYRRTRSLGAAYHHQGTRRQHDRSRDRGYQGCDSRGRLRHRQQLRMLKDSYLACKSALEKGGIENAAFEAQCMLEHLTGFGRASLLAHGGDAFDRQDELDEMIKRRLKNEPLQYILGSWSFCGIELLVGEGVLIPRDDTEVVLNLCLDFLKNKNIAKCVDLCSGSGAIALALERYAKADVTAVELSDKAFYFLEKNIKDSNIDALKDDVLTCHTRFKDNSFDLIVSNPPYIPSRELPTLQAEVQFEPSMALDGGDDGCDFYRAIVRDWSSKLKTGGALAFELGEGQADAVRAMMEGAGFTNIRTETDFGGTHRAIIGTML